jgi:hypothetical protein
MLRGESRWHDRCPLLRRRRRSKTGKRSIIEWTPLTAMSPVRIVTCPERTGEANDGK